MKNLTHLYLLKYKMKKNDISWKVATLGLLPADTLQFEFKKTEDKKPPFPYSAYNAYGRGLYDLFELSELTAEKLKEDEPETEQFQKILKKLLYAKRPSAAMFYEEKNKYGSYAPMAAEPDED
jgi:hypothetical protein